MKILTFSAPVDASHYLAGFGPAKGAALRSTDYDANTYRFSLVRPDDTVAPQVNGLTPATPVGEDTAAAEIRAAIAATLPA